MGDKYGIAEQNKFADSKNWEIWDAPQHEEVIYQMFPEFTCLCPRSGYPDFAKVHLIIVPDKKIVELKCLKLWFNSFRNVGISHEDVTVKIATTLFETLKLKYIFVLTEFSPRGNLVTYPMTELNANKGAEVREEIKIIKEKLLRKII